MSHDAIIVAYAKLRAAGRDARADLLAAAAHMPGKQRAAFVRTVEDVAALYEATCARPKKVKLRDEPVERRTRVTRREQQAQRRYLNDYAHRMATHTRTC